MLKGAMLCKNTTLNIVEITNNIPKYDLVRAAFVLKNAWRSFPDNTIHIVTVNDLPKGSQQFLAIQHNGHYFLGPNNGIFSLLFEEMPAEIYELSFQGKSSFPLIEIMAQAVGYINEGKPFAEIGRPIQEITQRLTLHPVMSPNQLRGSVIYIDDYENVVVNIHRELFEKVRNGRNFQLYFKRNNPLTKVCEFYFDVPVGEPFCRFNATNYLEIAVNMGKASSLFNLKIDDTIQIDFS
jgi:S-adenosylmethionine hydrolase